jgi:acetylornithine deacetylase/succinyl-diaminopimelate desuccinylase-like protein
VRAAAAHLSDLLRELGLPKVEIFPTKGHPIVYGEWMEDPAAPTVLVYGHYDVQPIMDPKLWTTPAFEPSIRDGKIFARGATDDKGQLLVHVLSAGAHLAETGRLPVNVKFLVEGEEEIGSEHLEEFVRANEKKLACDVVVISDTAMYAPNVPSICTGLRGIAYVELTIRGPKSDLHSGSFGGAVENPVLALANLLAGLKDLETGRVAIEGFYDDVLDAPESERAGWRELPAAEARYVEMTGSERLHGEKGYTLLERIWARPTLDVNGIWGGFTGKGSMTVLPSHARAKVSMRLVKNQRPDEIAELLRRHVEERLPNTVVLERFEVLHGGHPWTSSLEHPAIQAAFRAVERGFGSRAVPTREGGSIPIVPMFAEVLGAPAVLMGFGLHDEGAHGPDEHFDLSNFQAGIRSSAYFLQELQEIASTVKGKA